MECKACVLLREQDRDLWGWTSYNNVCCVSTRTLLTAPFAVKQQLSCEFTLRKLSISHTMLKNIVKGDLTTWLFPIFSSVPFEGRRRYMYVYTQVVGFNVIMIGLSAWKPRDVKIAHPNVPWTSTCEPPSTSCAPPSRSLSNKESS